MTKPNGEVVISTDEERRMEGAVKDVFTRLDPLAALKPPPPLNLPGRFNRPETEILTPVKSVKKTSKPKKSVELEKSEQPEPAPKLSVEEIIARSKQAQQRRNPKDEALLAQAKKRSPVTELPIERRAGFRSKSDRRNAPEVLWVADYDEYGNIIYPEYRYFLSHSRSRHGNPGDLHAAHEARSAKIEVICQESEEHAAQMQSLTDYTMQRAALIALAKRAVKEVGGVLSLGGPLLVRSEGAAALMSLLNDLKTAIETLPVADPGALQLPPTAAQRGIPRKLPVFRVNNKYRETDTEIRGWDVLAAFVARSVNTLQVKLSTGRGLYSVPQSDGSTSIIQRLDKEYL